jgi:4-amino-4-deoxy-L-arabinose transferase-like glycosyltransferase
MTISELARRGRSAIVLILLLFSTLGAFYAGTIPLFETPDEPAHYDYIKWISDTRSLPPLLVSSDPWEQGEFHQPPLYYLLGALLTLPIETGATEPVYERNPYAALGVPSSHGNKNAVLHLGEDRFPPSGVGLAVRILRCFGILCGLGTVYLSYRIAREVVPEQEAIALGAAALAALNPQFIFASAGVNNDVLVTLLSTATLYLCVRAAKSQARLGGAPAIVGLAVGLTSLCKISGIALLPLVPLAYWLRARRIESRRLWRHVVRPTAIAILVGLMTAGWWYGRNALQYGDLLGMRSYHAIFSVHGEPLSLGSSWKVLVGSFPSYWGVFGWMNILAADWFYAFFRLLTGVAVCGLGLSVIRYHASIPSILRQRGHAALPLLLWALIMLGLMFQWSRSITRTQGRLTFPALSSLSLFLAIGLAAWSPPNRRGQLFGALIVVLVVIALLVPLRFIAPSYALPQRLTVDQVPVTVRSVNASFGDQLVLLGYELSDESVRAGESLYVWLYWLCRQEMDENYTFYTHLARPDDLRLGGMDSYPGAGMYPTRLWTPGEVVVDVQRIDVRPDVRSFRPGILRVGVYRTPGFEHLPALDAQGNEIHVAPEIARLRVVPAQNPHYEPQHDVQASFGGKVQLTGYDVSTSTPKAGQLWEITLYWQTMTDLAADHTVFLHLVNDAGELVTQEDQPPRDGQYPTHLWQAGDLIKDEHQMQLPDDLQAGSYYLRLGLYLPRTGRRLDVVGADPAVDHLVLGPFEMD